MDLAALDMFPLCADTVSGFVRGRSSRTWPEGFLPALCAHLADSCHAHGPSSTRLLQCVVVSSTQQPAASSILFKQFVADFLQEGTSLTGTASLWPPQSWISSNSTALAPTTTSQPLGFSSFLAIPSGRPGNGLFIHCCTARERQRAAKHTHRTGIKRAWG
ncbi:uncharacterized protein LOC115836342 isoform X1 [Nomascus leucogenys]|uniref:uncharacterized protein LOC115836342 isoform X1 n=1 Tax=Nomascus leucogenys TaxID=61853 RepID=UPI00122D9069|nr:uncharacterized protein LOC115836342 isoform X1 [Nomascus leucogenys]